jgi:hypothetical protein
MKKSPLKRYSSVRWTWWKQYNLKELMEALKAFELTLINRPKSLISPVSLTAHILEAKADTLKVWLSPIRAGLFQKEAEELTEKDEKLKEIVFKLYPRWRSSPFALHAPVEEK